VFPNPADGLIQIQTAVPTVLNVYNAQGALVVQFKEQTARVQFDVQDWSAGLYHAVAENGGTTSFVVR